MRRIAECKYSNPFASIYGVISPFHFFEIKSLSGAYIENIEGNEMKLDILIEGH